MNYYNEYDAECAAWLRELIAQKLIPNGEVDTRSITDVSPTDLLGFTQCHFFAGIGGWSLALRLAGCQDDRELWTGSCPCQPFSTSGKGLGQSDERHLWPVFFNLIRQRRPQRVLGEQVANAIRHGWLDGISADLEAEGYAVGAAVLGAHSVGAPHQRQRLYWVANATGDVGPKHEREPRESTRREAGPHNAAERGKHHEWVARDSDTAGSAGSSSCSGVGDAKRDGLRICGRTATNQSDESGNGPLPWDEYQLIQCRDGKLRRIPVESALFPLADGLPYKLARRRSIRPALLRGAGNAIVPQVAAAFIKVTIQCLDS